MTRLLKARIRYATIKHKVSKQVFDSVLYLASDIWSRKESNYNPRYQIECDIQDQKLLEKVPS